jgi:hypothetical protein
MAHQKCHPHEGNQGNPHHRDQIAPVHRCSLRTSSGRHLATELLSRSVNPSAGYVKRGRQSCYGRVGFGNFGDREIVAETPGSAALPPVAVPMMEKLGVTVLERLFLTSSRD